MTTLELEQDGEAIKIIVVSKGRRISEHIIHAVGPNGSIAHFTGGPTLDPPPAHVPRGIVMYQADEPLPQVLTWLGGSLREPQSCDDLPSAGSITIGDQAVEALSKT